MSRAAGIAGWVLAGLAIVSAALLAFENQSLRARVQSALEEQVELRERVDEIAADKTDLERQTRALAKEVSAMASRVAELVNLVGADSAGKDSP